MLRVNQPRCVGGVEIKSHDANSASAGTFRYIFLAADCTMCCITLKRSLVNDIREAIKALAKSLLVC